MSQNVRATVEINGNLVDYSAIILFQKSDWHHHFEIKWDLPPEDGLLENRAKDWIGKSIRISWQYVTKENFAQFAFSDPNVFDGVVKSVGIKRGGRNENTLIVYGQGLSCLLDDGTHTRSFTKKNLLEITDIILNDYQNAFSGEENEPKVEPANSNQIHYLVQYKESNYKFLLRVAAEYGEWFFYDGNKIIFGKPKKEDPLTLIYGEGDFYQYELSVKSIPLTVKYKGYDYLEHEFPEAESSFSDPMSSFAEIAHQASTNQLFSMSKKWINPIIRSMDKDELQQLADLQHRIRVHEMVVLKGASGRPNIKVGSCIDLRDNSGENLGAYIVTAVTHQLDVKSNYVNHFEAVPVEVSAPPVGGHIEPPFCETQLAEVVETNDPKGIGRVRVRFLWQQKTDELSPWIRVATPYTGGDKGFFVIPEIEDFVLVDFEHHDPDKPYVLSGFYHGKAKPPWQDEKNTQKVWTSRKGHQIILNDEDGKESITISNPEGKNLLCLSMEEKPSITIHSEDSIILTAKENIILDAKNVVISASADAAITASNAIMAGSSSSKVFSGGEENGTGIVSENGETTVNAKKIALAGQDEVKIDSAQIKLNS